MRTLLYTMIMLCSNWKTFVYNTKDILNMDASYT